MKRGVGFLVLALVAGCSGGKGNSCVPGQSAACACSDGTSGAQICRGDGSYGQCVCGGGSPSSIGDMATGGSGGGGGGSTNTGGGGGTKRIFVTSIGYSGSVVSTICQTVADSVNLGGTWKPWLSHTGATTVDAIDAIQGSGPWVLLDGTVAFANHAQLATTPSTGLSLTEKMIRLPSNDDAVWTGTQTGGVHSGEDCGGWSTTGVNGTYGSATLIANWTVNGTASCGTPAHVYCFEQ